MASTILDTIADYARQRVAADSEETCLEVMRELALQGGIADGAAFESALRKPGMSFICEVKKASPSKGIIAQEFPYLDIAKDYEAAGADCISCLTEPKWFLGSDQIFREIRQTVATPMIRKDFTVDEYQIYQAKVMGANAVLLICALLDTRTVARYLEICENLGLAALVEAHDKEEIASRRVRRGLHHRSEQPEPEGLLRGLFQRRPAAGPDPTVGGLCGRERRDRPRRRPLC